MDCGTLTYFEKVHTSTVVLELVPYLSYDPTVLGMSSSFEYLFTGHNLRASDYRRTNYYNLELELTAQSEESNKQKDIF